MYISQPAGRRSAGAVFLFSTVALALAGCADPPPLCDAVSKGDLSLVQASAAKYGNLNQTCPEKNGRTPLHLAAAGGFTDGAKFLLEKGADVNATDLQGETPLHLAAKEDNTDVALVLIDHGAAVNSKDDDKQTPLHYAAARGNIQVIRKMLQAGADIDATDREGRTPDRVASENDHRQAAELIRGWSHSR